MVSGYMPPGETRATDSKPGTSLVIAAYDMQRQLARTLRSLSPVMQTGVSGEDYELIVVDNGSPEPIDGDSCDSWGASVRWLRVDDAPPSPARALNAGIAEARAPLIGAMVDGARLASPGLLEHALVASLMHPRPVIATLGFHLGDEPQQRAVQAGYDEEVEAELLERAAWEQDGYRLFDISVPGLSSVGGWLNVPAESNALFMPAALWRELDGFDEAFRSPGGGLLNLDLFARACELSDSRLIILLGEATFHQVHGGATTNNPEARFPDLFSEYEEIRGRPYARPSPEPLFLGSLPSSSRAAFANSLRPRS